MMARESDITRADMERLSRLADPYEFTYVDDVNGVPVPALVNRDTGAFLPVESMEMLMNLGQENPDALRALLDLVGSVAYPLGLTA